jgi:hypothetical protein
MSAKHWPRLLAAIFAVAVLYGCWKAKPGSDNPNFVAHFGHAILFGWISFGERVLPQVQFALAPIAFALLVFVITWALLYLCGKRWWGWTWRAPLVLICAPLVVFAIVLASAGIQQRLAEIAPELGFRAHMRRYEPPPKEIFKANFGDSGERPR